MTDDFNAPERRFEQVDLSEHEIVPATWLYEPILLAETYTSLISESGTGKTIVALSIVKALAEGGQTCAYLDMENGPDVMKERLVAMGMDMAAVKNHVRYFPYPHPHSMDDLVLMVEEVLAEEPVLVVLDDKAGFLTSLEWGEDSSGDNTAWLQYVVQPFKRAGVAVLEPDHSGHTEKHRGRGSSAKISIAEASWVWSVKTQFDPATEVVGTFTRGAKNRRGALPQKVAVRIGGTPLVFEVLDDHEERDAKETEVAELKRKRDTAIRILTEEGEMSQGKLVKAMRDAGVKGATGALGTMLEGWAEDRSIGLKYTVRGTTRIFSAYKPGQGKAS